MKPFDVNVEKVCSHCVCVIARLCVGRGPKRIGGGVPYRALEEFLTQRHIGVSQQTIGSDRIPEESLIQPFLVDQVMEAISDHWAERYKEIFAGLERGKGLGDNRGGSGRGDIAPASFTNYCRAQAALDVLANGRCAKSCAIITRFGVTPYSARKENDHGTPCPEVGHPPG
jgi:hypothetical protein